VKKFIIFAVALFVLGFAASSFAIPAEIPADTTAAIAKGGTQVTIGGELRVRTSNRVNVDDFNKNAAGGANQAGVGKGSNMIYDSRYRLSVEAKVSPNTIGFIQLEAADTSNTGENSTWGASNTTARSYGGSIRFGDQKQNEFRVLQAWMQHTGSGLFGIPAYIKVGHQMITVGAGVFYSHTLQGDDAIVVGVTPIKGLDISFLTVKLVEGLPNSADDMDLYSGMVNYAINKNISVGADVSFLQAQNESFVLGVGTVTTVGAVTSTTMVGTGVKMNLWNFGVNAKAAIAGFKLYGTLDYQAGSYYNNIAQVRNPINGYAFTAGGSYTLAPVTLALNLGYGSGDHKGDGRKSTFMTSQSDVQHMTFVYDYMTANAAGNIAGGLQNTMFAQAAVNADVMKSLNVAGSLTFLNASQRSFNTGVPPSFSYNDIQTGSRYLGTEVDATITYQIDKGLKYYVEAGYLFAGNYWKSINPSNGVTPGAGYINAGQKLSDPWAVRQGIQLNF
jgi:hypothetical protein